MATTSPDNLWSPDSGDDYSLTLDWAASLDTVQAALTSIRNSFRRGVFNGNTDNQGFITVTHGFSSVPTIVLGDGPVNGLPDANTRLYDARVWDVNSATFRVRYRRIDTGQWLDNPQAVVFSWIGSTGPTA